ncbi:helix-turn-helix transcriptional regulator [Desulfosporosinus sp. PR]|uniref:helix-turn-helix domain-containing protein n=1 Tax=Candidatus Desulfosporosinus nitrosoreducens TaxID=3401928 RepID=UPI0027F1F434|nr:helix-turn-helix transcriptional regulator [Desulfosporosinus sp. PR]MDQ7094598.1 helix-turn-helix transcriptional regulator [Desulfosporosinus sp. PR]
MDNIGERIKFLRETKGISMNKLEDAIGAPRGSVNKWEKGSIPGGHYLVSLSDFFNVTADWILKGDIKAENSRLIDPFIFFKDKWEVVSRFKDLDDYEKNFIIECIKFAQHKKCHEGNALPKEQTEENC